MKRLLALLVACSSPAPKPDVPPHTPPRTPPPDAAAIDAARPDAAPPDLAFVDELEPGATPTKSTSQANIAAQSNRDGIALAKRGDYAGASAKFRDAVARMPDAIYFWNTCVALYLEGKPADALTACNAVDKAEPKPAVQAKAARLIEIIRR